MNENNVIKIKPSTLKIFGAKAKDGNGRPVMSELLVKDGVMFCADGFIVAAQRTDYQGECAIHADAIAAAGFPDKGAEEVIEVTVTDKMIVAKGKHQVISDPPDIGGAAIPNIIALAANREPVLVDFALSAKLLKKMLRSLPGDTLHFRLRQMPIGREKECYSAAIEIAAHEDEESTYGLIMPMCTFGQDKWLSEICNMVSLVKGKEPSNVADAVMASVADQVNSGALNRDGITCTMKVGETRTSLAADVAKGLVEAHKRWNEEDKNKSLHDRVRDDLRAAGAPID